MQRTLKAVTWVAALALCACTAVATNAPTPTMQPLVPTQVSTPLRTPAALSSPLAEATTTAAQSVGEVFSGARALTIVQQQVAFGPRISGTPQSYQAGNAILHTLTEYGWITQTQVFTYQNTLIRNLWGTKGHGEQIIILGAHYDTRRRADQDSVHAGDPVPGANDGASGVAVLLELARTLDIDVEKQQIWLVFFDAEDNGELDSWDWIIGSQYFADSLSFIPSAVVIVDMVGDSDQQFYYERNSDAELMRKIWDLAEQAGYGNAFIKQPKYAMLDDHTPFASRGYRAIDIIDFDYPYWHTTADTPDKISAISLERVGHTLELWIEHGAE
jgi:glutaminyl-peptide cyclotransferase